ncbi:MAG: cache domain-containing protein [Rubrivivax sp.]|nr:cache domain-containing protein [Rubrivivax sp.]
MNKWNHVIAALAVSVSATFAQASTIDDASGMVDAALAEIKAKGLDGAIQDFNAGGKWVKGGTYVVVVRFDGQMLAHSANGKIVGKNMLEAKDAGGKPFVQENIAAIKVTGNAKVDLRWSNPTTKQIADAVMISKRVPGQEVYVGSVAFK